MELIRKFIFHSSAALFIVILAILGASVVARYALNDSIVWAEELMRFLFIWMFFLSMAEVSRNGAHLALDLFPSLLPPKPRRVVNILIEIISIAFLAVLCWYAVQVAVYNMRQNSPALLIPYGYIYFAIPVGCVLMILFSCQRIRWLATDTVPQAARPEEATE
jgi:TRAP-type C4-dicarboxylate transport system permease small subunit